MPLDARLGLPAGDFVYVLEDWQQRLYVKESFGEATGDLAELLGVAPSVRAAVVMNRQMAEFAEEFRAQQPLPRPDEANKMQMSYVGAVYTIDRFVRTPDDVLDELARKQAAKDRPKPRHNGSLPK